MSEDMTKEEDIPDWVGAQEFYGKYDPKEILGRYAPSNVKHTICHMHNNFSLKEVFTSCMNVVYSIHTCMYTTLHTEGVVF